MCSSDLAFFERGAADGGGSPEWKGNVLAYDLPSGGGTLTQAWEHRAILDAMNPASRNLVAFMPFDGGMSTQNFVSGNSVLTNYIDNVGTYSNEGAASVTFARNEDIFGLLPAGNSQKFGTQLVADGVQLALWPVDPATTDSERAKWGLPPLAEIQRRLSARSSFGSDPG